MLNLSSAVNIFNVPAISKPSTCIILFTICFSFQSSSDLQAAIVVHRLILLFAVGLGRVSLKIAGQKPTHPAKIFNFFYCSRVQNKYKIGIKRATYDCKHIVWYRSIGCNATFHLSLYSAWVAIAGRFGASHTSNTVTPSSLLCLNSKKLKY